MLPPSALFTVDSFPLELMELQLWKGSKIQIHLNEPLMVSQMLFKSARFAFKNNSNFDKFDICRKSCRSKRGKRMWNDRKIGGGAFNDKTFYGGNCKLVCLSTTATFTLVK